MTMSRPPPGSSENALVPALINAIRQPRSIRKGGSTALIGHARALVEWVLELEAHSIESGHQSLPAAAGDRIDVALADIVVVRDQPPFGNRARLR